MSSPKKTQHQPLFHSGQQDKMLCLSFKSIIILPIRAPTMVIEGLFQLGLSGLASQAITVTQAEEMRTCVVM